MSDEYPYPFAAPSLFKVAEVQRGKDEHEARIRLAERDRIIALLEAHHRETQGRGDLAVKYESAVLRCLALIKGENNE